jgi:hypothetical protein
VAIYDSYNEGDDMRHFLQVIPLNLEDDPTVLFTR